MINWHTQDRCAQSKCYEQPSNHTFRLLSKYVLFLFGYTAWMLEGSCQELNSVPHGQLEGSLRDLHTIWMKTIQQKVTSPWMKQLRIIHSEDWCLRLVLCTPSSVHVRKRWMNELIKSLTSRTFVLQLREWLGRKSTYSAERPARSTLTLSTDIHTNIHVNRTTQQGVYLQCWMPSMIHSDPSHRHT